MWFCCSLDCFVFYLIHLVDYFFYSFNRMFNFFFAYILLLDYSCLNILSSLRNKCFTFFDVFFIHFTSFLIQLCGVLVSQLICVCFFNFPQNRPNNCLGYFMIIHPNNLLSVTMLHNISIV